MQHQNKELEEYMASIADGEQLDPKIAHELESRLGHSPELRVALTVQTATKSILQSRKDALHIQAPESLKMSILQGIHAQTEQTVAPKKPTFFASLLDGIENVFGAFSPKYAFPVGIALGIIGFFVYTGQSDNSSKKPITAASLAVFHIGENNFCKQAYDNFHAIEKGSMTVQKVSANEQELKAFFAENGVKYPVFFPKIDASLVGGVVSDYKGTKFAHFIYKVGEKLIYAYEVPQDELNKHHLAVHPRAMEIANKADWYWEQEKGASNTMVLWKLKSNICTIVTNLRTEQLSALIHV